MCGDVNVRGNSRLVCDWDWTDRCRQSGHNLTAGTKYTLFSLSIFFFNLFKEALKEKYIHEEQSLRRKVVHFN